MVYQCISTSTWLRSSLPLLKRGEPHRPQQKAPFVFAFFFLLAPACITKTNTPLQSEIVLHSRLTSSHPVRAAQG